MKENTIETSLIEESVLIRITVDLMQCMIIQVFLFLISKLMYNKKVAMQNIKCTRMCFVCFMLSFSVDIFSLEVTKISPPYFHLFSVFRIL